jgi:hypothetical protein
VLSFCGGYQRSRPETINSVFGSDRETISEAQGRVPRGFERVGLPSNVETLLHLQLKAGRCALQEPMVENFGILQNATRCGEAAPTHCIAAASFRALFNILPLVNSSAPSQ